MENFEKWVNEAKFRIMRPNTMNKYGAVLDDFGLETMLDKLMEGYIRPISKGDERLLIVKMPVSLIHRMTSKLWLTFYLFIILDECSVLSRSWWINFGFSSWICC